MNLEENLEVIFCSKMYPIWDFTLKVFTTKIKQTFVNFVENRLQANHYWKLTYANLIVEKHARIRCQKSLLNRFFLKKHLVFDHGITEGALFCNICPFLWKACLKIICKKNMTKKSDKKVLTSLFYFPHLDLTGFKKNVKMTSENQTEIHQNLYCVL